MKIQKKIILLILLVFSISTTGCSNITKTLQNPERLSRKINETTNKIDEYHKKANETKNKLFETKDKIEKYNKETQKQVENKTKDINEIAKNTYRQVSDKYLEFSKTSDYNNFKNLTEIFNQNKPDISNIKTNKTYIRFSKLDSLGRVGPAEAVLGPETLPYEKRKGIGMVKPSGWHTYRFDDLIKDKYLYNRCHLIAHELCGQNANPQNLMTGTRALNVDGMLPFENTVTKYIKNTKNHVYYKVTPHFKDNNLVADYITMQAYSIEDKGNGINYNIKIKNEQPGITIDYKTGQAWHK